MPRKAGKRKSNAQYASEYASVLDLLPRKLGMGEGRKRERYKDTEGNTRYRPKFTPSEKGIITKLVKESREYRGAQALTVPKKRGESKKAYKRRVSAIKAELGQSGTHTGKVFYRVPQGGKVSFKGTEIVVKASTVDGTQFTETFYPLDVAAFLDNPERYLSTEHAKLLDLGKYATIAPIFKGGFKGRAFDIGSLDEMIMYVMKAVTAYTSKKDEAEEEEADEEQTFSLIVGFEVRVYPGLS